MAWGQPYGYDNQNGTIVNALNESNGITYTDVNYSPILAVRRIF